MRSTHLPSQLAVEWGFPRAALVATSQTPSVSLPEITCATALQNPANVIAYNGGDGVTVTNTDGNAIVRNSMHDNGDLGIDLDADGPTPNDGAGDPDSGGNTLQNGPDIDDATTTEVEWELETVAGKTYRLEFFANDACDPSGSGEGQTFLGTIDVTTDNNGEADDTTPLAVPAGKFVSMTATRLNDANLVARSTSEFSPCEEVQ
jgi:trimeric autotransporter adhesin